jgi:hypothetical protein
VSSIDLFQSPLRVVVALCAFTVLTLPSVGPAAPPSSPYIPVLPGDRITIEEAIDNPSALIATAVLKDLGGPDVSGGPGNFNYADAEFKIRRLLRGKCRNNITLHLQIYYYFKEENPISGMEYILFILPDPAAQNMTIVKMLPADKETIAKVTKAIAAASSVKH